MFAATVMTSCLACLWRAELNLPYDKSSTVLTRDLLLRAMTELSDSIHKYSICNVVRTSERQYSNIQLVDDYFIIIEHSPLFWYRNQQDQFDSKFIRKQTLVSRFVLHFQFEKLEYEHLNFSTVSQLIIFEILLPLGRKF